MKLIPITTAALLLISAAYVQAQGTLVFDQQLTTYEFSPPYAYGSPIQNLVNPWGQSFTPTLSSIDFIRLTLDDGNPNDGRGATAYVTLRSGAIDGPVIGTTPSITMANGFSGVVMFTFPSSVPLVPGTMYYFNPVVQDYSNWYILAGGYNYQYGYGYNGGQITGGDVWFREGIIVVPEPSATPLVLLGAATLCYARSKRLFTGCCAQTKTL